MFQTLMNADGESYRIGAADRLDTVSDEIYILCHTQLSEQIYARTEGIVASLFSIKVDLSDLSI